MGVYYADTGEALLDLLQRHAAAALRQEAGEGLGRHALLAPPSARLCRSPRSVGRTGHAVAVGPAVASGPAFASGPRLRPSVATGPAVAADSASTYTLH